MGAALEGMRAMNFSYESTQRGLYRSRGGILLGVCEGLARRFGFSPWGVRLGLVLAQFFLTPWAIVYYVAVGFMLKKEPCAQWRGRREY